MTIHKRRNGAALTVALEGRVDTTTAPELEAALGDIPQDVSELTIDCSGMAYISSAGLRVLLMTQRAMRDRGSLKLTHLSDVVREVLEVTGFTDFLTIE